MHHETEDAHASNGHEAVAKVSSAAEDRRTISGEDDMRVLNDAVSKVSPHAVKDLLSLGICIGCIFRLSGVHGHIFSCPSLLLSILHPVIGEPTDSSTHRCTGIGGNEDSGAAHSSQESECEPVICSICLGVLQFSYFDDEKMLVKKDSADELAVSIANLVKKEGHEFDNFSLEVSIPPVIAENEHVVLLYMKKKYGSELWFQEKFLSERISAKDALKSSLCNPLEKLLDVKSSGSSTFRIRLTYAQPRASGKNQNITKRSQGCKRMRTGTENIFSTVHGSVVDGIECSDISTSEADAGIRKPSDGLQDNENSDCFKFPLEKVNQPCHLAFLCYRTHIYIGGRYLKYSRNVSQTRWIIDDERMGEASVEEIIGGNILPMCLGDNYKFHAAGREDINVRMLGSGRPFLVEIQNSRHVPSEALIKEIEVKINNLENKLVRVKNLKLVDSHGWSLMQEGEEEKQKQYAALVWIDRPLKDEDMQAISSLKDKKILQRTPIRVLHRRSPLEREKIIHWMKIEKIAGSSQYFLLHLCTQAGTYIKEFVHGDLGRTHPSVGSILGCRAEILQLDVTEVKMDCFLDE
ncbi:hypothetical protein PVL29_023150 [Vitis rotundifolia]|uniref:tRNA pseudouridine(55) synthase n=1 Tax=Vitis rotundifolia TaxID=103349 RepID=A0AA38YN21_VITRO|nr:hypothetical protein PVL29_023150 [Vitis rotundifolia]